VLSARYLYLPVLSGAEGAKETDFTFRCYPLTDDKDFTNFFHPEKESILQLVSTLLSTHWVCIGIAGLQLGLPSDAVGYSACYACLS
jgi:hypothetical protein